MLRDVIISFCEKILLCFIFVNSACFLCGGVGVYMSLKENMCKMCGISYRRGLYCCSFSSIGHFSRPQSVDRTTDGSRFFMPLSCRNSSDQQKNNGDWLRRSLSAPCLLSVRVLAEFNRTRGGLANVLAETRLRSNGRPCIFIKTLKSRNLYRWHCGLLFLRDFSEK